MKKLTFLFLALVYSLNLFAWGSKGHDVVAYIAEQHLTPKAAKAIDKILNGHSLVYYSSWMDGASHTDEYAHTKTWHYINVDEGLTLETAPRNPNGDVQTAIESIIAKVKKGDSTEEQANIQLKFLIHLVGDMHCPMHAGRVSDRGGNSVKVKFFGSYKSLHSVWDSAIVESAHKWSYSEWAYQIDRATDDQKEEITNGSIEDWVKETLATTQEVYAATPEGANLSYDYVSKMAPMLENQLLKGGLRLAKILNELYGK